VCYPIMRRVLQLSLPRTDKLSSAADIAAAKTALAALNASSKPIAASASEAGATAPPTIDHGIGLFGAILLAILGGVLLNLMPCVLPVLSLKVLGLADSAQSKQAARQQANWYTAGVLLSFLALGLILLAFKQAGSAIGWGFQLQNPFVVSALAMLMFVMGLNLSGVVSFGNQLGSVGANLANADGRKGAFFTGVLACIVATPCTGPFMFTALGYAFTQNNSAVALAVLLALGFGLALPFLLIGYIPALATRLPKPGAWMESLKQWLAFPLYGTAIWLIWVFSNQTGTDGGALLLVALLLVAAACWWWEKQRYSTADSTALARAFALLLALLAALTLSYAAQQRTIKAASESIQSRIEQAQQQGKAVFVDVTADWCITCKVNERNAIYIDSVQAALKQHDVQYLVADYTDSNPEIARYLDSFKAVGVPLYVVYPAPQAKQKAAFVLPQLLTPSIVLEAIRKASEP
jgi:thiol:disulfide interchange protein